MGSEQLYLKHYVKASDDAKRIVFQTFMEEWVAFYRDQFVELGLDFMEARYTDGNDNERCTFYVLRRDRSEMALHLCIKHESDSDNVSVECDRYTPDGQRFRSAIDHGYCHEISEILGDATDTFHTDVRQFIAKMAEYL
jgi:hypothetical protein